MRALPLGGEQHWHVRDAHASRQAWQYIGEVSDRIDVGELAATEQVYVTAARSAPASLPANKTLN